jgi:pimeloyl-ACP methyl ester carboxylesterase
VLAELPESRRVCRFDRPGAGDSPPPRRAGRDGDDLDRELAAVADRADPTEPVVLVGHSFGSYPVLRYAATHRDRVRSVVLLDGVDPTLGLLSALDARSWSDVRMAREGLDLAAVQQQTEYAVSGEHPLGNVPLVVVRRGEQISGQWSAAQERLADLSTSGRLEVAEGSGHQIPVDAPSVVVAAITEATGAPR